MTGALPAYGRDLFPIGIARGFAEGAERYGLLLDTLEMKPVNGFAYARQIMVGEPKDPSAGPPPGWLLYILTRVLPEFRKRNKNSLIALRDRIWEKDLAEWDDFYRADSISRNLALVDVDLPALDTDAFIEHLNASHDNMLEMYYRHHKWSITAIYPVGSYIFRVTESGKISAGEAIALLKGSTPVSRGAFGEELMALGNAVKNAGKTVADLLDIPAQEFVAYMHGIDDQVSAAFNEYYRHVSQMLVSGYSVADKTVSEAPNLIKTRVIDAMKEEEVVEGLPEDTKTLEAEVKARLNPEELATFEEWVGYARGINRIRDERGIYNDIWGVGVSRIAVLEAGRRLVEKGVLGDAELAIEATHEELVGLLKGESSVTEDELKERANWRLNARIEDVPEYLGTPPDMEPPPIHLMPVGLRLGLGALLGGMGNMNDMEPAEETGSEKVLKGISVSPGVYEGTARVISGPEDFARLEQGDVLITKNTSAAFNVVLPILGALVTDRGGLLSHAAIVSREYGIPGVVATKKATQIIADGSRVSVDGEAGTVSVLS
jgi:pyruvate,water dikinase